MKIPKKFKLGAQTFNVEKVEELVCEDDALGFFKANTNKIQLYAAMSEDKAGHTFCHELTHAILHSMNHELWTDEEFVDLFGLFLHQALESAWGKLEFKKVEEDE